MFSRSARQSPHRPEYQHLDSSPPPSFSPSRHALILHVFPVIPPSLAASPPYHTSPPPDTLRRDQSLPACQSADQSALRGAARLHPAGAGGCPPPSPPLCTLFSQKRIQHSFYCTVCGFVCVCVLDKRAHKSMPAFILINVCFFPSWKYSYKYNAFHCTPGICCSHPFFPIIKIVLFSP